ncbi:hypothetical protein GOBAR_AA17555 [Gossypium barbadense]|uniref:Uncharacterized protein n=1 Tax=Gossypium barbadense TaxID=3634 RepID=A0A2P5XIF5_GOSBA|nr:hypothetical protein GOBAR_AA17555 [Gossypium barbadense]
MLSKFISVSETHFQNTETALKNQQASIQGLETQIGQLSKLISERPQGSLPSNTEPNLREHLNAISTQDKEGFIAPEPELQQDNTMNKGREEVNNNDPKQELSRTKTIETVRYYHKENKDVDEERRLRIKELDEWREHKLITHDKPKLRKHKPDTSPNQLQVDDTVLLDAADPHIVTTTPNEEIPLTVLSIFPFGTVEVSHPKFGTFKPWPNRGRDTIVQYGCIEVGHDFHKTQGAINPHSRKKAAVPSSKRHKGPGSSSVSATAEVQHPSLDFSQALQDKLFKIIRARPITTGRCIDWAVVEQVQLADAIRTLYPQTHGNVVMTNNDDPGTIHFRLGGLVRAVSVPELGVALGLYIDEFMEEEDMNALPRNIHISPSLCWKALAPFSSNYDPNIQSI